MEVDHVSKRFGSVVAVDDVSFSIGEGEFFSLLGPSGCGKTTMLRMISGFEQATSGEIRIKGASMNGVPPFKRPTNLVFQHLALFPHLNVYENIAFGLRVKKFPEKEITKRIEGILEIVRLPGMQKRKIRELSGGQQQRIAIARALVNEPTVLLLDEPLGPLDLKLRLEMQVELKRIQHEVGTTFIYVTHDQGEAIVMSNRIAVMSAGKVEQLGTPEEIYDKPLSRFVADFIGEANIMEGVFQDGNVDIQGLTVRVSEKFPDGTKVTISVRPENIRVGQKLGDDVENAFNAHVKDVRYKGAHSVYDLELDNGLVVKAHLQSGLTTCAFSAGSTVRTGWNSRHCVLLT